MELLQPKQYHLRINLEQIQHIFDGVIENRKLISGIHRPLYDAQIQDLQTQMRLQGVHIELGEPTITEEDTQKSEDAELARRHFDMMDQKFTQYSMDPHELQMLKEDWIKLKLLVFGE